MRRRRLLEWAVLVVAAGLLVVGAGGCDKKGENAPTSRTIERGDDVFYQYREDRERQVTDRRSEVPLAQRGGTVVRSGDGRFASVEDDKAQTKVWMANLLTEDSEGAVEARLRSRDHVLAARKAGSAAAGAGSEVRERAADAAERIAAQPLLWQVATDGEPVYLFGTLHRAEKGELDEMAPQVQEALRGSDLFVMETDLDGIRNYVRDRSVVLYPKGTSLRQKLSRDHWKQLLTEVGDELPDEALRRFRPWVVLVHLSTLQSDHTQKEFMDVQLRDWAKTLDKSIEYLESPKRQIDAFRDAYGLSGLRTFLDEPDASRIDSSRLEELYSSGDLAALEQLMFESSISLARGSSGYRELLVERNEDWLPAIESYIDRGGVFIAAGCAHFIGSDSVVALLRENGYDVERVP